jgi:hypothetical protein
MPAPRLHSCLALLLTLFFGAPAVADDADTGDTPKNQLVVFGGYSILDATTESSYRFPSGPDFPGFPGLPGRFRPGRIPDFEIGTTTSLGNSALFGVRYSRYLKDRLAVEADFQVAPTHDLGTEGEICVSGRCFGSGGFDQLPGFGSQSRRLAEGRRVTAWQYGAGLAYDITGGDVRPVVLFGAGGATWSGSGRTETDFELRFGAGLKVLFGRVGARVDVVDHLVLDHFLSGKSEHNVQVTAGFLVGF